MGKAGAVTEGAPAAGWSVWTPLEGFPRTTPVVLAELLDGGQSFRWYPLAPGYWIGGWSNYLAQLRITGDGGLEWSAPEELAKRTETALRRYLALESAFARHTDDLPWRSDPHLAQCIAAFLGLRILNQPFGETLLGFLCSATKQIVQIKQMVGLLAERHGRPIVPAKVLANVNAPASLRFELPTWSKLAAVPEAELRTCLLGFRARYIAETARFLASQPGWLAATEQLPYQEAKTRLCSLPGVGEKVADCVLLFGDARLEAFPVDVWILKAMAKRYALEGWKPAHVAQFGRVHFGKYAGLAQQLLFAWERRHGSPRKQSS